MKKLVMITLFFISPVYAMKDAVQEDIDDITKAFNKLEAIKNSYNGVDQELLDEFNKCKNNIWQLEWLWNAQKPDTFQEIMDYLKQEWSDDSGNKRRYIKDADEIDVQFDMLNIVDEDEMGKPKAKEAIKGLIKQYANTRKVNALLEIAALKKVFNK